MKYRFRYNEAKYSENEDAVSEIMKQDTGHNEDPVSEIMKQNILRRKKKITITIEQARAAIEQRRLRPKARAAIEQRRLSSSGLIIERGIRVSVEYDGKGIL